MYAGSRSFMNSQDSHGMYSSWSMGYSGSMLSLFVITTVHLLDQVVLTLFLFKFPGSYSSSDAGGMYSSYGSDYIPGGSNVCLNFPVVAPLSYS